MCGYKTASICQSSSCNFLLSVQQNSNASVRNSALCQRLSGCLPKKILTEMGTLDCEIDGDELRCRGKFTSEELERCKGEKKTLELEKSDLESRLKTCNSDLNMCLNAFAVEKRKMDQCFSDLSACLIASDDHKQKLDKCYSDLHSLQSQLEQCRSQSSSADCPSANGQQITVGSTRFIASCNRVFHGQKVKMVPGVGSYRECLNLCAAEPECRAASLDTLSRCWVYRSIQTETDQVGMHSGKRI
ncbi:hypothetical protein BDW68DRAFT_164000 [Aspergillus falconensis]